MAWAKPLSSLSIALFVAKWLQTRHNLAAARSDGLPVSQPKAGWSSLDIQWYRSFPLFYRYMNLITWKLCQPNVTLLFLQQIHPNLEIDCISKISLTISAYCHWKWYKFQVRRNAEWDMKVVVSKLIPRLDKLYSSAQQYTHLINKLLCLFKNRIKIFFQFMHIVLSNVY